MSEAERRDSSRNAPLRVLLLGATSPHFSDFSRLLERAGVVAETRLWPEPNAGVDSALRTLVFVDLDAANELELARVSSLRELMPSAVLIALVEGLDGERAARLLATGIASLPMPVAPAVLTDLVQTLGLQADPGPPSGVKPRFGTRGDLSPALDAYAVLRVLSRQQRLILGLYLEGSNDKLIAERCRCSEATVYEHWRRMAKKAGGTHKADAISDFHRFLAGSDSLPHPPESRRNESTNDRSGK